MREIYYALLVTLPIILFFILMKLFFNTLRHPKLTTSEKGEMKKYHVIPQFLADPLIKSIITIVATHMK